jgi:hypothetical protein
MAVEYEVRLKDGVSGPAKAAAGATDHLRNSLGQFTAANIGASSSSSGLMGAIAGGIVPTIDLASAATSLASGLLEVAKSAASAVLSVAEFALKTSDAKRSLLLQLEALTGSAEGARDLSDAMDNVAATGLLADEAVEKIGRSLAGAGYKGEQLKTALDNVAKASAVGGEEAGAKIEKLYEKIAAGGGKAKIAAKALVGTDLQGVLKEGIITADQLGQAIKTRFGDVASKQSLSLTAQYRAMQHNLGELFEDIDFTPLLEGLKSITSLLDQNTASGKIIKQVITDAFQYIGKVAAKVFPAVKMVMLELIISGLKIAIALKPAQKAFNDVWNAIGGGSTAMAVVRELVSYISMMATVMAGAIAVTFMLSNALSVFLSMAMEGGAAARSLIDGLVNGITAGASRAIAAVKGLGSKVVGGLKDALGWHSPSTITFAAGKHGLGEGLALGAEASIPRVTGATRSMAAGAIKGMAGGAGGSGSSGGRGGAVVHIGAININGAGRSAEGITELMVSTTFERIALAQGAG